MCKSHRQFRPYSASHRICMTAPCQIAHTGFDTTKGVSDHSPMQTEAQSKNESEAVFSGTTHMECGQYLLFFLHLLRPGELN